MPQARPVVDYNRCEGKAACVEVCPSTVFEVRTLTAAERGPLSPVGHLRRLFHGGRQALVAQPDRCIGCGRCVEECPEGAIRLLSPASGGPAGSTAPPP